MRSTTMMMATAVLAIAAPVQAQTLLDTLVAKIGKGRQGGPGGAAAPSAPSAAVATIAPAQSAAIDRLLATPMQDPRIAADRTQAAPLIRTILATASCARHGSAFNTLNRQMLTPTSFDGFSYNVMVPTRYHDQSTCLDVVRLTDWAKPALNALSFRAYYVAGDSGEAVNQGFSLQRSLEGEWLIRQVGYPQ